MQYHPITKKRIIPVPDLLIEGVQYYRYTDMADYTESRRLMFQVYYKQYNRLSMSDDDLKEFCFKGIKACKARDTGRAMFVFNSILDMIENSIPDKPLYQMAALMYFTLDEDVTLFDASVADAKVEAFRLLPVDGFFLPQLLKDLGLYKTDLQDSIHIILRKSKLKIEAVKEILNQPSSY